MSATVVVLGASAKPHRYAFRAQLKLQQYGYNVIAVARNKGDVAGFDCLDSLADINLPVDTVTVYINAGIMAGEIDKLLALNPRRVIFNPGTESQEYADKLRRQGIEVVQDCTLVMLDAGRF